MEVLLLKDVPKLGQAGDSVRVADGYARNYLFPRRLAMPLNEGARRQAQTLREARQRRAERQSQEAMALAQRINGLTLTVQARAGEHGKLYGSVTAADIAEQLAQLYGAEVDRRKIMLSEPIRDIGRHQVEVRLSPQAVAHIVVVVEKVE
ncbi:MAG: 50S ribosomal protein L9 [Anaerolineae bacterium]